MMLDVTRQLYNAALEHRRDAYRKARISIRAGVQHRELTEIRAEDGRVAAVYRECEDGALHRLDLAMKAFFRRCKRGETAGFPRFRSRSRWETIDFPHGNRALKLNEGQSKVYVPGVGVVRLRKGRAIPQFGRAMITRRAGRWYATFEYEAVVQPLPTVGRVVGIDRGIALLAATSDGETYALPGTLAVRRHAGRVAQRRVSRRKRGGKNRRKAVRLLQRAHERVAHARRDALHKISRSLVDKYDTIVIERLAIGNMTRSAKGTLDAPGRNVRQKAGLNREILNAGWGILRQLIVQKAESAARTIVEVDPRYTSQECAACGVCDAGSRRSQATFVCVSCGHVANADSNAARVILKRAKLSPVGSLSLLWLGVDLRSGLSSGRTRLMPTACGHI